MKSLVLAVRVSAYELSVDGQLLARLDGGSRALLAGAGERLRNVDVETAIERAEDWLMPTAKAFQRLPLHVEDATARLLPGLGGATSLTPDAVERAFTGAVDAVAFQRSVDRDFVADLVLLRELVHHGAAPRVALAAAWSKRLP